MTEEILISAAGRKLSIQGTAPVYLQWFTDWNADASAIYSTAKNLPTGATVIDVGANIGMLSCSLAAQRPDLKIFAIEPVPENVECLRRNVSANGLANIEVIHAAASDKPGTVHVNVNGPWSAVLPKGYGGNVEVPAVTIDSFANRRPAYIKIDVEGWEPYVLAGARATIASSRPLFFMEWNTWSLLVQHHDPISFALAVWDGFDILEQFYQEKEQGAPKWNRQIVQDNIVLFASVSDLLMRPKPDAVIPSLDEMIYPPKMVDLLRREIAR